MKPRNTEGGRCLTSGTNLRLSLPVCFTYCNRRTSFVWITSSTTFSNKQGLMCATSRVDVFSWVENKAKKGLRKKTDRITPGKRSAGITSDDLHPLITLFTLDIQVGHMWATCGCRRAYLCQVYSIGIDTRGWIRYGEVWVAAFQKGSIGYMVSLVAVFNFGR